jgi:hypothetical protein
MILIILGEQYKLRTVFGPKIEEVSEKFGHEHNEEHCDP